jgi:excisionase family DNA binding protein
VTDRIAAPAAAVRARVSREVLVRWIQKGQLKGWRVGRFWEVDAADLSRLLSQRAAAKSLGPGGDDGLGMPNEKPARCATSQDK